MSVITQTFDYHDDGTLLEAYIAYSDTTAAKPCILIAHMWGGRVEFVCEKARTFAALGYTAFALDMYGKGVLAANPQHSAELMQPFIDDRGLLQRRMLAALDAARSLPQVDPNKIIAIGYCFGGLCVLDLARSGVAIKGVISVHGLLHRPDPILCKPMHTKVLVLHGSDDPMANRSSLLALQDELSANRVDWQTIVYGNTQHAFTNPAANNPAAGTVYNRAADRRATQHIANFLTEILGDEV